MSLEGLILNVMVVIWLIATIAYQYKPYSNKMAPLDIFRLLPRWTFFAPNPAMRDCHVLIRDQYADGSLGPWTPLALAAPRGRFDPIWHPSKRARKIMSDASQSLKTMRREAGTDVGLQYSLPYLLILNCCVSQRPCLNNVMARQFALVETSSRENRRIWITFTSELHPL